MSLALLAAWSTRVDWVGNGGFLYESCYSRCVVDTCFAPRSTRTPVFIFTGDGSNMVLAFFAAWLTIVYPGVDWRAHDIGVPTTLTLPTKLNVPSEHPRH